MLSFWGYADLRRAVAWHLLLSLPALPQQGHRLGNRLSGLQGLRAWSGMDEAQDRRWMGRTHYPSRPTPAQLRTQVSDVGCGIYGGEPHGNVQSGWDQGCCQSL